MTAVTDACISGKRSHVHDVSNVSTITDIETMASRVYGARMNEPRHVPAAPSVCDDFTPSGMVPPWSMQISTALAIHASTGWSADSKPSTNKALPSATPADVMASP